MARTLYPWRRGGAAFALILFLAGGCGLSDYEAKMLDTQARVQRFEDENKKLDEPVDVPTVTVKDKDTEKERKVPLADLFFRPPRGIAKKAEDEPRNGILYRYSPRQSGAAGSFVLVELAFGGDPQKLMADVMHGFSASGTAAERHPEIHVPGRKAPVAFSAMEFDDGPYTCSVNFYPADKPQMAVVFWVTKGQLGSVRSVIDLSLGTLRLGPEAGRARLDYKKPPWGLEGGNGR